MLTEETKRKIAQIWDEYVRSDKVVLDTRGRPVNDIDQRRITAIEEIEKMISDFVSGKADVREFKTALDGYNKKNNLWGFTATKGQMFFNQLTRSSEENLEELSILLRRVITKPNDLNAALEKIGELETYARRISLGATDKRKVPNPGSVGYFLSYFWQIHDNRKWPLMYTSLTKAFTDLGIWEATETQQQAYRQFYNLNEEIKEILSAHSGQEIMNWDAEHAFWNFTGNIRPQPEKRRDAISVDSDNENEIKIRANFDVSDYLVPKVAGLVRLGADNDKSKASLFEKLVSEIFELLGFEVDLYGQGSGRNPDAIIKYRGENTAFIVDAKAYSSGYGMGVDDRAILEYVMDHCPRLQRDGYKKIGFIIVSNSFKSNFDDFKNDITWNTDIKRFVLITSEALLFLLAYKIKNKLGLTDIVDGIISLGNPITAENIIEKFDDI